MPKARISAAMLAPRDRAHAADRRDLQFLAAGVATVARTRTSPWPENHIPIASAQSSLLSGWKFPVSHLGKSLGRVREAAGIGPSRHALAARGR